MLQEYPAELHNRPRLILREYLQYKILEILFESPFARKFSFLGGTCLRIVHGNRRFSEDLDFDNFNLLPEEFEQVANLIAAKLQLQGYETEMKNVFRGAYHCHIRFPGLLFEQGLSGYREEKILIQLDTEPQHFDFQPELRYLNRFDVFTGIFATPPDLLLAQKFTAICNRRRKMGRDFYDAVFLLGQSVKPNYDFLAVKLDIHTPKQLRERVLEICNRLDMNDLATDVQPILFDPADDKRVRQFAGFIGQAGLG